MKKIFRFQRHLFITLTLMGVLVFCSAFTTVQASAGHDISGRNVLGKVYVVQAVPLNELHRVHSVLQVFPTMQQALAAIPTNTIILGTLFADINLMGRDLIITGPNCSNQGVSNLNASNINFNDITSSLFNSCRSVTLFFDAGFRGPQQSYGNGRTSFVGSSMNDQASSVLFHS